MWTLSLPPDVFITSPIDRPGGSCRREGPTATWPPSPTRPNAALRAADGTRGSHSGRWPEALPTPPARCHGIPAEHARRAHSRSRDSARSPAIRPKDALGLALGVLHRLFRCLGARERRLQAVVERLCHALIVVRAELRHRVLELVARHGRGGEAGHVLL